MKFCRVLIFAIDNTETILSAAFIRRLPAAYDHLSTYRPQRNATENNVTENKI